MPNTAHTWPQGTPFAVLGNAGDGRIELNAYDTPRISLIEQGDHYNIQTERIRIGDLANWQGGSMTGYGIAIEDGNTTSSPHASLLFTTLGEAEGAIYAVNKAGDNNPGIHIIGPAPIGGVYPESYSEIWLHKQNAGLSHTPSSGSDAGPEIYLDYLGTHIINTSPVGSLYIDVPIVRDSHSAAVYVPSVITEWSGQTVSANAVYTLTYAAMGCPANVKAYAIRLAMTAAVANTYIAARTDSTYSTQTVLARTQVANVYAEAAGIVNANASGGFDLVVGPTGGTVYFIVTGYFL